MSFLTYQRSDPRYSDWLPLVTQQLRLRNLIQIIGINLNITDNDQVYYTLHLAPMSAPFFTSENVEGAAMVTWREIEPRQISHVKLSAAGLVIRIWSTRDGSQPIVSWGVHFKGLQFLGVKGDWNTQDFAPKSILIRLPFGFFTAVDCLVHLSPNPQRFISYELPNGFCRKSYSVKNLAALHRIQRSLLEELEKARRLRFQIGIYGFSSESSLDHHHSASSIPLPTLSNNDSSVPRSTSISKAISQLPITSSYHLQQLVVSGRALLRVQQEKNKIKWKEEIESKRLLVSLLRDEKGRAEGRVHRLKQKTISMDDVAGDLMNRVHALGRERDRLRDYKNLVQDMKQRLAEKQAQLNLRKKQLISELLVIYPLQLVEGSKRFSISEVQLPNAEDYGNENGAQISVALGYTGHLVAMLSFFLGIPLRYPIKHFGSRSRIIDHITTQIPNKEREFPLYFRGREDVYSKYAVYLLNKNIAQLRWYCGLSSQDLRASLPNLYNVLTSRLTIPGWPPSPGDNCEVAQELTEEMTESEIGHTLLHHNSLSLDGGLDQLSSTPKALDDSWLRSSFSDLEGAGGNAVPSGEIYHGRAQNRFLSGWKKKTTRSYTEPEQINPEWLTNSLNLEFDLGRRPSITPSPPLPFIVVSSNESLKSNDKSRKRRYGRVEQTNVLQQNNNIYDTKNSRPTSITATVTAAAATITTTTVSPTAPPNKLLPTMESASSSSSSMTPNSRMVEVEQQIKVLERRKSICDMSHGGSPTHGGHPPNNNMLIINSLPSKASSSNSNVEFLPLPDVPQADDWPTTDEEKLDDSIADVMRKISLMEMQLNRLPPQKEKDLISDESESYTLNNNSSESLSSSTPQFSSQQTPTQSTSSPLSTVQEHEDPAGNVSSTTVTSNSDHVDTDRSRSGAKWDEINFPIKKIDHGKGDDRDQVKGSVNSNKSLEGVGNSVGRRPDYFKNSEDGTTTMHLREEDFKEITPRLFSEISCDNDDRTTIESRLRDRMQLSDSSEEVRDQTFNNSSESYNNPVTTTTTTNIDTTNDIESTEDDPSSLWLRTEALLSSQSFNMVRRRISESN